MTLRDFLKVLKQYQSATIMMDDEIIYGDTSCDERDLSEISDYYLSMVIANLSIQPDGRLVINLKHRGN